MKTILMLLTCILVFSVSAQNEGVAINTDGSQADISAILDLKSTSGGLLIPRMTENQKNVLNDPAPGLLVFQTNADAGFYYYTGSEWIVLTSEKSGWSINGNQGTNGSNDFIGTTDAQDLTFRTNNIKRFRVSQNGQLEILNTGQSVFVGEAAGELDDLTNNNNVFIGFRSGYVNLTGNNNVASGQRTLYSNETGSRNTALGTQSLYSNTSGYNNTASGYRALYLNTEGHSNVALGYQALYRSISGIRNSSLGHQSLRNNTEGTGNVSNGFRGLYQNISGDYNTGIGYSANSVGTDFNNSTGIGYNADNTASNSVKLGNSNVTSIGGQVGWTTLSDGRFKQNVRIDEVQGIDFIMGLRPVTYNYDVRAKEKWMQAQFGEINEKEWEGKYDIEAIRFSGFIAQEVEELSRDLGYEFSGVDAPENAHDIYGLRYADFVVPLVKSTQELNEIIQSQKTEISALEAQNELLQHQVQSNTTELNELKILFKILQEKR
jgi:hypothetical protein